eukprot:14837316-Heterocapsa_arctica.AAC.1
MLLGDVSTAFLHAPLPAGAKVYVIPPACDRQPGKVWRMKALYGLRQSPRLFQEHLAGILASEGYVRLRADPQLYHHP